MIAICDLGFFFILPWTIMRDKLEWGLVGVFRKRQMEVEAYAEVGPEIGGTVCLFVLCVPEGLWRGGLLLLVSLIHSTHLRPQNIAFPLIIASRWSFH